MADRQHYAAVLGGVILVTSFAIGFYLGYLVLKGIFTPLLFAILFAVVSRPVFNRINKSIKNAYLSSILCCLILSLLVIGLISFVVYLAVGEVVSITKVFTSSIDFSGMEIIFDQQQIEALIDQTIQQTNTFLAGIPYLNATLPGILEEVLKNVPPFLQSLSSYVLSFIRIGFDRATNVVFDLMVFFISFFFLLIDGNKFMDYLFKLLPINALHERQITKRFANLCYAWIVVNLLLALIQGLLAVIGFSIIGVPSPLIWGIVTMIASFIPFVGSGLVWAPIAITYFIIGYWWSALFILLWGVILISSSDNILRPFMLKEGIQIHPLIVFLAVLGGFYAFSVPGLIIGPIIMVFLSTLLYIYELEFGDMLRSFHQTKRNRKN